MMFCPNKNCRDYESTGFHAEFVDGVTVCPTCGEPLVEELDLDETDDTPIPSTSTCTGDNREGFVDFEPVLETDNVDEVAPFRALLDAAWIPHLVLRPNQLGPLRESRPFTDYEPIENGFVFLVPSSLAESAREVVAVFDETGQHQETEP